MIGSSPIAGHNSAFFCLLSFIVIVIIIKLTHSKTILEITVEIEPQPVALDFKNLSQYSSHSKLNCLLNLAVPAVILICFNLLPNCLGAAPKETATNGMIFTLTFHIFCNSFL